MRAPESSKRDGYLLTCVRGEELAHTAEALVAAFEKLGQRNGGKFGERLEKYGVEKLGGLFVIGVRAAFGFGNHGVDKIHIDQFPCSDFQRFGGKFGLG